MGELRTSITELAKQVATAAKAGEKLAEEMDAVDQRVVATFQRLEGGTDVLWTYLVALFEKNGRRVEDHLRDKVSEHADSEIVTYLKGIDSAANDVLRALNEYQGLKNRMPAEYDRIDNLIVAIRRNLEKKRSKLFQSKAYKAKLVTYDKALNELAQAVANRREAFGELDPTISVQTVETQRIKAGSTIADVRSVCTMSIKEGLRKMKVAVEQNTYVSRKFRQNGDLKQAFEQMKKWASEADAIDEEVLRLDPNAVKPIKEIKIFHGQRLVATAPKAVFQGKRPMEVASVTWQKGVDSLSLLQQKVRLEAEYVTGDGTFAHDMKINGIKGQTVKLT